MEESKPLFRKLDIIFFILAILIIGAIYLHNNGVKVVDKTETVRIIDKTQNN